MLLNISGITPKQKSIIEQFPIVHVLWEDAHSTNGWFDRSQINDFAKSDDGIVSEIGYLIEMNKYHILLATKILQDGLFGGVMKIPRTWAKVTKIT